MTDVRFVATVNTAPLTKEMKVAEKQSEAISRQMIGNIRRSAELGIAMYQAFGGLIDQVYAISIQAGLRSIELVASYQALVAGIPGVNIATVFFQAAAIAAMVVTIVNLKQGRREAAVQSSAAYRALQLATWKG